MSTLVKVWALIILCFSTGSAPKTSLCGPGRRAVQVPGQVSIYCDECPTDTYMDKAKHTDVTCKPCFKNLDNNTEIVERNCTQFSDTVIRCKPESFRVNKTQIPEVDRCKNCTQCELGQHQARPCQDYDDTVCCHAHQVASLDPATNKFKCYDNFCGQNQYFERYSESCRPCPPGTLQPPERHRDSYCVPLRLLNISSLCGEKGNSSDEVHSTKGVEEDNTLDITTTLMPKDNYSTDVSIHDTNTSFQETTTERKESYSGIFIALLVFLGIFLVLVGCLILYSIKRAQSLTNTKVCEFFLMQPLRLFSFFGITMTPLILFAVFGVTMLLLIIALLILLLFSLHELSLVVVVLMDLLLIIYILTFCVGPFQKVVFRDGLENGDPPSDHPDYKNITGSRLLSKPELRE